MHARQTAAKDVHSNWERTFARAKLYAAPVAASSSAPGQLVGLLLRHARPPMRLDCRVELLGRAASLLKGVWLRRRALPMGLPAEVVTGGRGGGGGGWVVTRGGQGYKRLGKPVQTLCSHWRLLG